MDVPLIDEGGRRPDGGGGAPGHAAPPLRAPHLRGAPLPRGPRRRGAPAWRAWPRTARRLLRAARTGGSACGGWCPAAASRGPGRTPAERERAIRRELAESKRLIEERTGQEVIHLCYPWHVVGPHGAAAGPGGRLPDGVRRQGAGDAPHDAGRRPPRDRPHRRGLRGAAARPRPRRRFRRCSRRKWRRRVRGRAVVPLAHAASMATPAQQRLPSRAAPCGTCACSPSRRWPSWSPARRA